MFTCCLDESINKLIISFTTYPRLAKTKIELVFQQILVLWLGQHRLRDVIKVEPRTSVPQSSTTGSVLAGWIPAHRVVMTSLAIEIRIPPTPWSPMPSICHKLTAVILLNLKIDIPLLHQSPQCSQHPPDYPIERCCRRLYLDHQYSESNPQVSGIVESSSESHHPP